MDNAAIGEKSSGSYINVVDEEGRLETEVTVAVTAPTLTEDDDDEQQQTITPLNTYTFRSIWRSFNVICALHGCYIPKAPKSMYCCEGHRDIAHKFSGPSVAACEVIGGFSSVDEIENYCGKALANHVLFQCAVGIPVLTDNSIFTTLPSSRPDVFKPPRPYSTAYLLFSPPARYEEEEDEEAEDSPDVEDRTPTIWFGKDDLYHDIKNHGLEEEIVVRPLKMGKPFLLANKKGEWHLYDLKLQGVHLFCFTFTPKTELQLTRFRKKKTVDPAKQTTQKDKEKQKKGRVYKDGVAGPVVAM